LLKNQPFVQDQFKISPENFAEFIKMIHKGEISSKIAKMVLQVMFETGADPSHVIEEKGLAQISNEGELNVLIAGVIEKNSKAVEDYRKGKENAFQFLVGQILAQSRGKANPQAAREILKKKLDII
jgi:aspartyl-tRNA(Asn)/glutamyl-tRNA(Gln) amidotransferase subunit B